MRICSLYARSNPCFIVKFKSDMYWIVLLTSHYMYFWHLLWTLYVLSTLMLQLPQLEKELLSLTSPSHDSVKEILNGYHEMVRHILFAMLQKLVYHNSSLCSTITNCSKHDIALRTKQFSSNDHHKVCWQMCSKFHDVITTCWISVMFCDIYENILEHILN